MLRTVCSTASALRTSSRAAFTILQPLNTYRWMSSASSLDNNDVENEEFVDPFVQRHLQRQHVPAKLHADILSALQPVYGKPLTVAHLKSFGNDALQALAKSVEESLPQVDENTASIPLTIQIPHHSTTYDNIAWNEGVSLLQLCKSNPDLFGEYMEGTCGGSMSCCTCHVYLSQAMFNAALPEPSEAELDMLDLAYEVKETSRLACQVFITDKMLQLPPEELVVTIPAGVVDLWS